MREWMLWAAIVMGVLGPLMAVMVAMAWRRSVRSGMSATATSAGTELPPGAGQVAVAGVIDTETGDASRLQRMLRRFGEDRDQPVWAGVDDGPSASGGNPRSDVSRMASA
jgi:hypothetical protein